MDEDLPSSVQQCCVIRIVGGHGELDVCFGFVEKVSQDGSRDDVCGS